MSEQAQAEVKEKKPKTEVTPVTMKDGRVVNFAGNRRMVKETLIDDSKIQIDSDSGAILLAPGAVTVRCDFRNGETVTFTPPADLVPKLVGHGGEQKLGDETAGEKDVDDMVLAVQDLATRLGQGLEGWSLAREAGGFSGASIVIRALMEATGKSQDEIKAFLQKKLDDAKARNESLSRKQLYDAFRNPNSKVGQIIDRMEKEKLSKSAAIDADAALDELNA